MVKFPKRRLNKQLVPRRNWMLYFVYVPLTQKSEAIYFAKKKKDTSLTDFSEVHSGMKIVFETHTISRSLLRLDV